MSRVTSYRLLVGIAGLAIVVNCAGCPQSPAGNAIDPELLASYRQKFLLQQEPADVVAVLDVREMFAGPAEDLGKAEEPDFPWKKDSATLFLVDPATAAELTDHDHDHGADDHHDCPFCARAAEENVDSIAVVNFLDDDGAVLPIGAQKLLSVEEQETVIVKGRARMMGGKLLVIDADGLYIRR